MQNKFNSASVFYKIILVNNDSTMMIAVTGAKIKEKFARFDISIFQIIRNTPEGILLHANSRL